jgi:Ger(x)C family germination protein
MIHKRFRLVILTLTLALLMTGCWDAKDVDQRSFVMGIAFDLAETEDRYVMTIELPVLSGFASQSSGEGPKSVMFSTVGTSVAQMATHFESRTWRELFFGHTQAIIISGDAARKSIRPFLDFFDRNPRIDRRLTLFISQGEAQEIFKTKDPREDLVSVYLNQMLETLTNTARVVKMNFQDSLRNLESNGDTILPRVRSSGTEAVIAGGALIKDYKLIAWLGENETRAAAFLYNNVSGGLIVVNVDDNLYAYAMRSASSETKAKLKDNQLIFEIEVKSEGDIIEVYYEEAQGPSAFDIAKIEDKLNQLIANEILHLVTKLQDLKTDPIGFDRLVFRSYPKFWKEHAKDWKDKIFPQAKFEIKTTFRVRRTGIVEKEVVYERQR